MKYTISLLFLLLCFYSCKKSPVSDLHFLEGTWKLEGKEQYEEWIVEDNMLKGSGYKVTDGKKSTFENLSIQCIAGELVYQATVVDQNNGNTIKFPLNSEISELYSFENLQHDFPKKIQYRNVNDNELEVKVLGDNGKGFTLYFRRIQNN